MVSCLTYSLTLKMQMVCYDFHSIAQCYITEDIIVYSHRCREPQILALGFQFYFSCIYMLEILTVLQHCVRDVHILIFRYLINFA
jgi:hypothetical protein